MFNNSAYICANNVSKIIRCNILGCFVFKNIIYIYNRIYDDERQCAIYLFYQAKLKFCTKRVVCFKFSRQTVGLL